MAQEAALVLVAALRAFREGGFRALTAHYVSIHSDLMSTRVYSPSVADLKRALAVRERIEVLQRELTSIVGAGVADAPKIRTMSAAGRARVAAAQRARWAKLKGKMRGASVKPKRKMSPAARAKIAAAAKRRWATAKAKGENSL